RPATAEPRAARTAMHVGIIARRCKPAQGPAAGPGLVPCFVRPGSQRAGQGAPPRVRLRRELAPWGAELDTVRGQAYDGGGRGLRAASVPGPIAARRKPGRPETHRSRPAARLAGGDHARAAREGVGNPSIPSTGGWGRFAGSWWSEDTG